MVLEYWDINHYCSLCLYTVTCVNEIATNRRPTQLSSKYTRVMLIEDFGAETLGNNQGPSNVGIRDSKWFHSEKFRGIDSERFSFFRGRKCSFQGIPSLRKSQFRSSERNRITWKNLFYRKSYSSKQNWERAFVSEMLRNWIPRDLLLFFYTERNSELLFFPRNVSEQNSESLFLFFARLQNSEHFPSAEGFGTEFREFSVPQNSQNSARNKLFVPSILSSAE